MNCILSDPSPATHVLQCQKLSSKRLTIIEKKLWQSIKKMFELENWLGCFDFGSKCGGPYVSVCWRLLKVCSCYQVRTKVTVLKRSLNVLCIHCLVVSSWRCSRSFGLEDKDNLWNSCLEFCCDWEGHTLTAASIRSPNSVQSPGIQVKEIINLNSKRLKDSILCLNLTDITNTWFSVNTILIHYY